VSQENALKNISVVIITRNEEDNIASCLESVKWASEVIVVDSESTDRTPAICKHYHVRFYTMPWEGYSRQKNSAIEKSTKDWILSLDADERITPALKREIGMVLSSPGRKDGYFIKRKNFFLGKWIKHCGWYPDQNLRLFKREKGVFGVREVHERVDLNGVAGYLENPMEHHTYTSITEFMKRLDHYSTLAARELLKENKTYGIHHIIFRPIYTFVYMYIIRSGFLEGYYGFILSVFYSFYTFSKYIKLRELRASDP